MKDKYYYEYEWDSDYCYPNSHILKNKLNITNQHELEEAERAITSLKMSQAVSMGISGGFNFEHLKTIHKFLFEDIYDWAGQVRTVNISKGNQFCRYDYIGKQAEILFDKLKAENYLKDCKSIVEIGKRLAYYLSEINVIHPFREGNGRTQRLFIELLAKNAGYEIDFMKITKDEMLEASARAYACDYELMESIIIKALSNR
jgi:cell filamentation protein